MQQSCRDAYTEVQDLTHSCAQVTALAPPNLLEKMSEVLTQHANPNDRGHASANLHDVVLPVLDEQEQASFHGALRRLDTLGDAVLAMVSLDTIPPSLPSPPPQRQR